MMLHAHIPYVNSDPCHPAAEGAGDFYVVFRLGGPYSGELDSMFQYLWCLVLDGLYFVLEVPRFRSPCSHDVLTSSRDEKPATSAFDNM